MIEIGKKCFNELCRPKLVQYKARKVGDFSFFGTKLYYNPEISGNENSVWAQSAIK